MVQTITELQSSLELPPVRELLVDQARQMSSLISAEIPLIGRERSYADVVFHAEESLGRVRLELMQGISKFGLAFAGATTVELEKDSAFSVRAHPGIRYPELVHQEYISPVRLQLAMASLS